MARAPVKEWPQLRPLAQLHAAAQLREFVALWPLKAGFVVKVAASCRAGERRDEEMRQDIAVISGHTAALTETWALKRKCRWIIQRPGWPPWSDQAIFRIPTAGFICSLASSAFSMP